ncbi:phosphatidylinositol N-acetylglucosaminyltransferase subunit H, putative [Plasmodium ovale]|uniref:Phosphatidylinositol N-acetylglucosaminyltransferase subunit H, putative n=2 Tax=Plasmodium ovale TaxID=36330 RepID=A0A1D3TIH8_PLAOA|nr:phosphatidylinositol N-acetylglucosaminyltransferase subunit H, putative [Plasmodium ovale]
MKSEIRNIEHVYGIEYISEKKEKRKNVFFVILAFSLYYIYYLYEGCKKGFFLLDELQILLFVAYLSFIVAYLNNHHLEKLFLVNNVGVQIERKNWYHHQLQFICLKDIRSVFINEAIYIFEICPYLCITLKSNKFIVLFEHFNLEMKSLVQIYRDMQRVIFCSNNKILKDVKATYIKKGKEDEEEQNGIEEGKSGSWDDQNCSPPSDSHQPSNNPSSEEDNIFKLLNFSSCESYKIDNKIREANKIKTFDIYMSKKLALEIMNS